MSKHISPSVSLNAFNCPHCGALASQTWHKTSTNPVNENNLPKLILEGWEAKFKQVLENIETSESKDEFLSLKPKFERQSKGEVTLSKTKKGIYCYWDLENVFASKCFSCKKIAIWRHTNLLHPILNTEFTPNPDLDDSIQADFREAATVLKLSPRSATALLRLCVQKLCIQLGKSGKNINKDIGSLVKDGLDIKIQKALDIVRVTGNNAVHPGELDLKDDIATATKLFQLVNLIADRLITQPKNIDAMFDDLPEGAKEAITKRDN